ncbi:MAG: YitT family protein [Desulfovibrionaceae bacterium]|nr:YitT family protein [Desulfovibrionaceae bacterium]
MKSYENQGQIKRVIYNLALVTAGSLLMSLAVMGLFVHHDFMVSGIFGTGMLVYYATDLAGPAVWYALICIPVVLIAWFMVSRRFFLYSIYAIVATTLTVEFVPWPSIPISDPLLAAVAGGAISGLGAGITLRSQGSDGGVSIIAIAMHQKFGTGIGQVSFVYNFVLFLLGCAILPLDKILYSIIAMFITTQTMEYVASLFNERKVVMIISPQAKTIADKIMDELDRGVTLLSGKDGFTGPDRMVVLTVIHSYQIKRLEEAVFTVDQQAFVIIESTFNVLGEGFSKRKIY